MRVEITLDKYVDLRVRLQKEFDGHIFPPHMYFLKNSPAWRVVKIVAQGPDFLVTAKGPEGQESMAPVISSAKGTVIWYPVSKIDEEQSRALAPQVIP